MDETDTLLRLRKLDTDGLSGGLGGVDRALRPFQKDAQAAAVVGVGVGDTDGVQPGGTAPQLGKSGGDALG